MMLADCEICHMSYVKDDRADAARHRRHCAPFRAAVESKPNQKFLDQLQLPSSSGDVDLMVDWRSPLWLHKEVYVRARLFKWEFGYDTTQWEGEGRWKNENPRWNGYLLGVQDSAGRPTGIIGGACGFFATDDKEWLGGKAPAAWSLAWVWIAPKYRRSGLWTQRWPVFRDRYGDFYLETPLSVAMKSFLMRHGSEQQQLQAAGKFVWPPDVAERLRKNEVSTS